MLKLSIRLLVLMFTLALPMLACSLTGDTPKVADTVDAAVDLLQEIEDSGTWETVSDGLQNLADQDRGYTATVRLRLGDVGSDGQFEANLSLDMVIDIQVDTEGHTVFLVTQKGTTREYFLEPQTDDSTAVRLYRVQGEDYTCVKPGADDFVTEAGLEGLFELTAGGESGARFLSVVEESGSGVVAGRDVTQYDLKSKVPEALEILEKIDNAELKQKIEETGEFALTGSLSLDEKTGALVAFTSTYDDLNHRIRTEFVFEVTQWGGVSDIPAPTANQIVTACE
jgi:hypothetical protein